MTISLFRRGMRRVFVRSTDASGDATWLALHLAAPAWDRIFTQGLALLDMQTIATGASLSFGDGLGQLNWTSGPYWTTIRLHFDKGSPRKREVVASALLKAAKFQPE